MVESRGHDAARFCLDDSPGTLAGADGLLLHHGHDVIDRVVVGGLDLLAHAGIPKRPQNRHALGWGEGEVETVHRAALVGAHDLPLDLLDARCTLISAQLSAQVDGERAQLVRAHAPPGVQVAVIVAQAGRPAPSRRPGDGPTLA